MDGPFQACQLLATRELKKEYVTIRYIFNEENMKASKSGTRIQHSRVVRAFASGAVDSGLIPSRIKPMTFKIGIHNFPA